MVLSPCFLHVPMVMIFWCMTRMVLMLLAYCMAFDNRFTSSKNAHLFTATNLIVCYEGRAGFRCLLVYLWFCCPKREWSNGLCGYVCSHLWFGMQRTMQTVRFQQITIRTDEDNSRFEDQHDDYNVIMAKAIADRLAEVNSCLLLMLVRTVTR